MIPPLGTREWLDWHTAERLKTRQERRTPMPTTYRPAITGPNGEQFWWRRDMNPIPRYSQEAALSAYRDASGQVEAELSQLKAALMAPGAYPEATPKNPLEIPRREERQIATFNVVYKNVFDQNKIA